MRGYEKGTTVADEADQIAASAVRLAAAIRAEGTPSEAFSQASAAERMFSQLADEMAAYRAWVAVSMLDSGQVRSLAELAAALDMSKSRAHQLVQSARKRGNPVTDRGLDPLPLPVVAAILTRPGEVMIEHRIDGKPPWTFPAAEIGRDESPAAALRRRIPQEIGLDVDPVEVIGERLHPRTGVHMIYMTAALTYPDHLPVIGDPADLDVVEWVPVEVAFDRMPDLFEPVHALLLNLLGQGSAS